MPEHYGFSFIRSNSYRFLDGDLDLELCCHPLSGKEVVTICGEVVSMIRNFSSDICYKFDFNGNAYTLIQGQPEDQSCRYYYELCKNDKPIQRYEIKAERKRTLPLYLLTLCLVAFLPVAAGEISEQYMGVSVLEWEIGMEFFVIVSAVLSAVGLHIGILSNLIRIESVQDKTVLYEGTHASSRGL